MSPEEKQAEQALVDSARAGDRNAYRQLVEKYQGRLFAVALDIVRNSADAEEVVQESFVKAYFALKSFAGNSSFYTWLYRIAHNMAIDYKRKILRQQRREVSISEDLDSEKQALQLPAKESEQPEAKLLLQQNLVFLKSALDCLSDDHREVLRLRELDGFSYEQIAKTLGLTSGTVMSRIFYARKKLQENMALLEQGKEPINCKEMRQGQTVCL